MSELLMLALATWALIHLLVFSRLTEWLRERLGIDYDYSKEGQATDRWADNRLGELLNCYSCTAPLAALAIGILWIVGGEVIVKYLAIVGAVILVGRWWTSQRARKEWWL